MQTLKYRISGKVQGVFFRASTRDVARSLGMSGRAVNRSDGSVEVVAAGTEAAHRRLERWLREGPRMARVDNVSVEACEEPVGEGFSTG